MKPTDEQQAAVDAARDHHVAITAGAGTGKTTTLKLIADELGDRRGLYVAFNKSIQTEADALFPDSVTCSTAHSLAYRAGGHRYRGRLNAPRLRTQEIVDHLQANEQTVYFEDARDGAKTFGAAFIAGLAMKTVDKFCQSADTDITTQHVPRVEGLDMPGEWTHNKQLQPYLVKLAKRAWWDDLRKFDGKLRFQHDHYLKLFQLSDKPDGMNFDYVFADEAQDLSPVMIDVFKRQAANGAQVIAVGDSNQAIYSWRGAVDGMGMIEDATPVQLSWCWRFGDEIAVSVNSMLDQLDADLRLVGKGGPGEVRECPDAKVILGRTNGAIVNQAMVFLELGMKFHIVGNLPRQVISFAEAAITLQSGRKTFHPELSWAHSWGEVLVYVEQDALGGDLMLMVNLVEQFGPDRIIEAMRQVQDARVGEERAERVLSTMHASKGREWPEVRLLGDWPDDEDGKPMLTEENKRLYYVAASRAERVLDIEQCMPVFHP